MANPNPAYFVIGGSLSQEWLQASAYTCDEQHPPLTVLRETDHVGKELVYFNSWDGHHMTVHLVREEFEVCPPMFYVLAVRPDGAPPNMVMSAFTSGEFAPGTVVSVEDAKASGVDSTRQVAAIQWGYGDPKLHQIFVHPDWRRRRIALAMIGAADVVNMAGNFSGDRVLYGGDVTTDGGETLRAAWSKSPRVMTRQGVVS